MTKETHDLSFLAGGSAALYEKKLFTLLRYSLAFVFVWFGVLKIAGFNPVFDLINAVMPLAASGPGFIALGVVETLIGMGLFLNRARFFIHSLLLLHLSGTFLTFIVGTDIVFVPYFPVLSLAGEFVVKNLVLAVSGLVVLAHERP